MRRFIERILARFGFVSESASRRRYERRISFMSREIERLDNAMCAKSDRIVALAVRNQELEAELEDARLACAGLLTERKALLAERKVWN
jgi:hypothetical protein